MQFLRITALLAVFVTAGCATTSNSNTDMPEAHPRVIASRVNQAGWSLKETRRASDLYALKCGRCHKFYDPAAYLEEDWQTWMRKMSRKAKLEPNQEQLLTAYLAKARESAPR